MYIKIIVLIYIILLLKRSFLEDNQLNNKISYNSKEKKNVNTKNGNNYREKSKDDYKNLHSIYGEKCLKCNKLIGEFNFKKYGEIKCLGYPRLYKLSDYCNNIWLLGGNADDGNIYIRRSKDKGLSWSEPILMTHYPNYTCSNVDFFELKNHDIISSYRAIGNLSSSNPEIKNNRKLSSSISHDCGETWENFGDIIDNFELALKLGKTKESAIKACEEEFKIGFFEPFVEKINNNITVFYADDFTIMLMKTISNKTEDNYRAQTIYSQILDINSQKWLSERRIIIDGTLKKKPTGSEIKERISREGMPVINKMKDGTYILVFEGTYRDRRYPLLTGDYLKEYHAFEILLSYSKDGIIWSNPVEIYTPKNNLSKASAPFVVSTEDNQIIISFQTDEDSLQNGHRGDLYSIMKVMISKPGINIKNINKHSFYAICNSNNSPINGTSIWNGMMIIQNFLYICSSDNTIKYSEIPIYDDPSKYNEQLRKTYYIKMGNITINGNKIKIEQKNTLVINKNINTYIKNKFFTYINPNTKSNCGLIFGIKNYNYSFLEKISYFMFKIDKKGYLILSKVLNGIYSKIIPNKSKLIYYGYDHKNTYKMQITFVPCTGEIIAEINDNIIFHTFDNSLNGSYVGFQSDGNGTIFTQIMAK